MPLESGTRLGHYQITDPIGKGGMGEVHRARDTKLGRDVAIKVLPSEFAQDAERLARLEREARMLAALNHPNIAAIYGLEQSDATRFLVLELVEGDTLADRLRRGAIPPEESLRLALQIAEALEAAHEKGVIHRDLKPGNIKITPKGRVKVLDFGLAKAWLGEVADSNLSNSPTLSMAATRAGIILGTAAYMSPEQARGREVDKRTDVWAFGCVLSEMLSGRPAFPGDDVTDILAAVIRAAPDWSGLPPNLNRRLRDLMERCLEKDVTNRYHDIADVRVELQKIRNDPAGLTIQPDLHASAVPSVSRAPWVAAILLALIAGGASAWLIKPGPPEPDRQVTRFDYDLPEGVGFRNTGRSVIAISPDGRSVVYNGTGGLYLKSMDELSARPIAGTDADISNPFFSPDGQWIGFWNRAGRIEKVAVAGGTPVRIGPAASNPNGISWGDDDMVLFTQPDGIYRVSGNGGAPERIVDASTGEILDSPQLLPNGKGILFTAGTPGNRDESQIAVQPIDPAGDRKTVWTGSDARYTETGHLIYALGTDLFAIAFDLDSLETSGSAVSLEPGLTRSTGDASANYAVSRAGSLAYASTRLATTVQASLVWIDRNSGEEEPLVDTPLESPRYIRLSPDGRQVVVSLGPANQADLWVYDIGGRPPFPLTFEGHNLNAVWSPDGRQVAIESTREGVRNVFTMPADGSTLAPSRLLVSEFTQRPSWWPEADELIVTQTGADTRSDILAVPLSDEREPRVVIGTEYSERLPRLSPDGNWLAYDSDVTGRPEIWIQPYPAPGAPRRVSTNGGTEAIWSGDGRELFYIEGGFGSANSRIMGVSIDPASGQPAGMPQVVVDGGFVTYASAWGTYDVSSDGERFLVVKPADAPEDDPEIPRIVTVLNWFGELRERVPVP
jgi:eukaryotic-like serine/threonine-protein kinase